MSFSVAMTRHLGATMQWMTPAGRGFDTSFGYLSGGEDHYTHMIGGAGFGCPGTDLYETDAPAYVAPCSHSRCCLFDVTLSPPTPNKNACS